MRELLDILARLDDTRMRASLATVVDVQGSAYRRPGARMLILENGQTVGGISGGCLEGDVIERSQRVIHTGNAELAEYDTSSEDDLAGLGAGCAGIVRILIEPVAKDAYLRDVKSMLGQRCPGVLLTAWPPVSHQLVSGLSTMIYLRDLEQSLVVGKAMNERRSVTAPTADGFLFAEYLTPPIALWVFGAGHDAVPLVDFAARLGWQVTVIDHRHGWLTRQRFPYAMRLLAARPTGVDPAALGPDDRTAAVVMTHHFKNDLALLGKLLESKTPYVGVVGSRARSQRMREQLPNSQRLRGPVGMDIGAQGPHEIALSIVAEVQAVLGAVT